MSSVEIQRPSPYQGLVPYSEADAPFFFGREKETRLIIANLFGSPLTLLYGASGVGKSSVLRAGVAHQLRGRDDLLVVVFNSWQSSPIRDLQQAVADFADLADHDAWRKAVSLLPQDRSASLAEFLRICAAQLNRRLMIILDQFEEYFLYHPQDDEFAAEFPLAVTQSEAPVSFLISIREDFYAKLDRFEGRIPTLYDNYLRIEHLDRNAARVAIEKPVAEYNRQYTTDGKFTIEPKLVEAVLKQVETGRVTLGEAGRGVVEAAKTLAEAEPQIETPFLQLVMTRLWDEECANNSHELQLETLKRLGGAENIVRTHLDAVITRLSEREQAVAANVFHYLVTPSGTKIAYSAPDLAESCGLYEAEVVRVLEKLSHGNVRILRSVDPLPTQPTVARYEIFHDVLAPAILAWRTAYVQAQERADAERRADELQRRNDEQARAARRLRWLAAALAFMFLLSLVATAFAAKYARESNRLRAEGQELKEQGQQDRAAGEAARTRADEQTNLAASEARRTHEQIKIAEKRKAEAEDAQAKADEEKRIADAAKRDEVSATERAEKETQATRVAFSNLLAAQSKAFIEKSPQRSLLLAVEAMGATKSGDPPVGAAEENLRALLTQIGGRVFSGQDWSDGEGYRIEDIALSYSGRWMATASNSAVRVFDLSAPSANAQSSKLEGRAPVTFSADGHWLITGGNVAGTVCLWSLTERGLDFKPITLKSDTIPSVRTTAVVSPNSRWLVTADVANVKLWDLKSPALASGKLEPREMVLDPAPFARSYPNLLTLAISPDSCWLVASSGDYRGGTALAYTSPAKLWSLTSEDPPFTLTGHKQPVTDVAFSSDGHWLVTGSSNCDDGARLWNLKTVDPTKNPLVLPHKGSINAVAFSPDNNKLVTTGGETYNCQSDLTARIWDLKASDITAKPIVLPSQGAPMFAAAFSPDSASLITVTSRGFSAPPTGLPLIGIKGTRNVFDPRDATATAYSWYLGGIKDNEPVPIIMSDDQNSAHSFAFSPDGRWLVAASSNHLIVWDTTFPYRAHVLRGHEENLSVISFSADSRQLLTGSDDKTGRVWDLSANAFAVDPLSLGELGRVTAFSPDHRRLFVTANEPRMRKDESEAQTSAREDAIGLVFDLTAQDPTHPLALRGHIGRINAAAFSLDNGLLATAGSDKKARLWGLAPEPARASEPLVFSQHASAVDDVVISPDKRWLATASHDGMTFLWDLTAKDPTAHAVLSGLFGAPFGENYNYRNRIYISPDSHWLVTPGHYEFGVPARLWDLKAQTPAKSAITLANTEPDDFVFSPNGRWLIVFRAYDEKTKLREDGALLWDLGKIPLSSPFILTISSNALARSLAFSSDSQWLFTTSPENAVRRWNLSVPDPSVEPFILKSSLDYPSAEVLREISLSSDDRWLVANCIGQVLWDLRSRDPNVSARVFQNPNSRFISEVTFDPSSQRLIVTDVDSGNRQWDLANPNNGPMTLPLRGTLLSGGAISGDGSWLITKEYDWRRFNVELWNMRLDKLKDLACRTAGRNLSERNEWHTYFPGQKYRKTCTELPAQP